MFKADDYHSDTYNVGAYLGLPYDGLGCYNYSIEDRLFGMRYYYQVADFDGDGKSDVAFINNFGLNIVFAPIYLSNTNGGAFSFVQGGTNLYSSGLINAACFNLCVGDFFGQGTASLFCDYWLFSKIPKSAYYSVDTITDGMGNSTAFEYGYLVNNPLDSDTIFSLSHQGENLDLSIYCRPLPIRALKRVVNWNRFSENPMSSLEYRYENTLVHKYGRGILGFAKTTTVNRLAGVIQSKKKCEFSTTDMASHPLAVLKKEQTLDSIDMLINECNYTYQEYKHLGFTPRKVFYPALTTKIVDSYDVVTGDFFRRTIENTTYTSYAKETESSNYFPIIAPKTTVLGVDANQSVTSASLCEFQTCTDIGYQNGNATNWVMSRPHSVRTTQKHLGSNDSDVETLTEYQYGLTNPFLVSNSTFYPGADEDNINGLATKVLYQYDGAGNVTRKTLRALDNSVDDRVTEYEYKRFQLPKLERNALGYETSTEYNYYWELNKLTDCNGLVTNYW